MTKWLAFQFILYYRFALKRVKMLRICTPRKFFKFSRNDILPPRHCEALAEAIHNLAHLKSYHRVIANEVKQSIIQNLAFDNSTLV
ncbi:hypothetical protein [Helicobacter rodentium]|uniref:hypothetical protein n=1 Tax=Helicobacter rodentium TaxID=59617 RepID=UPI002557FFD8|nr:hypothetical protein [Helicobacter rodentium]